MKMDEIISVIRRLSLSQSYYGRILHAIREMECTNPEQFAELSATLEAKNFSAPFDVVLYFE